MFSNFQERLMATVTGGRPEFLEDIPLEEKQNLSEEDIDRLLQLTVRLLKQNKQQMWRAKMMVEYSDAPLGSFSNGLVRNLVKLCAVADPSVDYVAGAVHGEESADPGAYEEALAEAQKRIYKALINFEGPGAIRTMHHSRVFGAT